MVLAKNMKGKIHLTNILDLYPEAMMREEEIYFYKRTKVYKIVDKSGKYVLKIKDIISEGNNNEFNILENEYRLTKNLGNEHPHFIKAIDFMSTNHALNGDQMIRVEILLEYGGHDLSSLKETATDKQITMFMLQSLSALLYSEKRKISHIDIKPKNMVYKNGILKIIDMGIAIEFTQTSSFFEQVGKKKKINGLTRFYAPPELRNDLDSVVCGKVDIYCWAMSFYEMISKKKNSEIKRVVDQGEDEYNKFLEDIKRNPKLIDFDKKKIVTKAIIGCLKYKPEDRLLFEDVQELLGDLADEEYEDVEKAKSLYYSIGCSYMSYPKNKDLAVKYFLKEISIYRKTLSNAKLLEKYEIDTIGSAYNEVGSAYNNMGNYKDALSFYEKALIITKKMLNKEDLSTADIYNNIGSTYNKMGEYKNALINYKEAKKIYRKKPGEDHLDTAIAYFNIGNMHYSLCNCDEALNNYEKTLNIRRKELGENHLDTALAYYNIGVTYERKDDNINAQKNYENAFSIRKKLLGENNPDTILTYNKIKSDKEKMKFSKEDGKSCIML